MATLDSELRMLLVQRAYFDANPSAGTLDVGPDDPVYIKVGFHGDIASIVNAGFIVGSNFGEIAYGVTTLAGLQALARHPQIDTIRRQRRKQLLLDDSIKDIKANLVWTRSGDSFSGYTGRGVIVGIIDTGIDFRHKAFRKADGTTRILKIWDQTLTAEDDEDTPDPITDPLIAPSATEPIPLDYGVEYTEKQINDTLTGTTNAVKVRHKDTDGHGTHVAGIAAGDGSQSGHCHFAYRYIGVATEADIIVVRMFHLTKGDKDAPTPSAAGFMLDAIAYVLDQARQFNKPAVLNLSLGDFNAEMDGNEEDCLAVDHLLRDNSVGRAIVFGAGNEANLNFHASATVPAGPTDVLRLPFTIEKKDSKSRRLTVVYDGTNLEARLTSPRSGAAGVVDWVSHPGNSSSNSPNGSGAGSLVTVDNDADRINIAIKPPTGGKNKRGTWTLELRSTGAATPINAFCLHGSSHDKESPSFQDHTTTQTTLTSDATGRQSISVGSCKTGGALSASSARGPTMNTPPRTKPDLAAPGEQICSAAIESDRHCVRCCCACCVDYYVDKWGTSMAAPHVSGVIAMMLHRNPNLTHVEIKDFLIANAAPKPSNSTPEQDLGWGAGRLDAKKTVIDAVPLVNPPVTRAIEALDEPLDVLHKKVLATERGPELQELFDRFWNEVWSLVQKNRRVATVWHRCRGPVWVRLALLAAHTPNATIPNEVEGLRLQEGLLRFAETLQQYGSAALRHELRMLAPLFTRIHDGMTLLQVIDAIGARDAMHARTA